MSHTKKGKLVKERQSKNRARNRGKNNSIREYLLDNPEKLTRDYNQTAKLFDVTYERVRGIARGLRKKLEDNTVEVEIPNEKITTNELKDSMTISVKDSTRVKSLDDLIQNCSVDLDNWEVDWFDIGTYEVTGFDNDRKPVTVTMYRTKAKFKKINVWENLDKIRKT